MTHVALAGGCIISRRFSVCADERFLKLVEVIRGADIAFCHLEGTIAEGDDPEVFPATEAGWTWIRMPSYFGDELKWAGFDIVSHASNHSLDYMYGGLYSTWDALKQSDMPYAGTGMTLGQSRKPAFVESGAARLALVSSSSSTPDWARAGDPVRDDPGRPGVNQIRLIQVLDAKAADELKAMVRRMGWWLTEIDDDFTISPPGLHNTVMRYRIADAPSATAIADPVDVAANLAAIRTARQQADLVIFHIHNHEWHPDEGLQSPPEFIRDLAHHAIDAGADIFIAEGAHSLLRGIEIYKGKAIFYDPGDLFKDGNSKTRPLSEYQWVQGLNRDTGRWEATTAASSLHGEIKKLPVASHPPGGYNTGKVLAVVVPVCRFSADGRLEEIRIHPAKHLHDSQMTKGLPGLQSGEEARKIIDYLAELSAPFGTDIAFEDGVGVIRL